MTSQDQKAAAPVGASGIPAPDKQRWLVLVVVSVGQLMIALDTTVASVMGPELQRDLGLSPIGLQWVFNNYIILFGGLLLLGGRLNDVIGRRRMFLGSLALFTAGSLLAAMAQTDDQILIARAIQGLAAAGLSPACLSILVVSFRDPAERAKAFGVWGAVIGVGAGLGTLLGGAIVDVNWRLAFYINIPIAVVLTIGAMLLIRGGAPSGPRPKADVLGGISGTIGLGALVFAIVSVTDHGWTDVRTLGTFLVALVLLPAFIVIENRAEAPLLPLRLFRLRGVVAGSLGEFFTAGLMIPCFMLLPIYMQTVLGYSPMETGLAYLPTTLAMMIVAGPLSKAIPKIGAQLPYVVGTVLLGVMVVLLIRTPTSGSYWTVMLPITTLLGVGLVLCLIPTPTVGTSMATEDDAGTTSALLNVATQVGGALALAISASVLQGRLTDLAEQGQVGPAALNEALHWGIATLFVWVGLSLLTGLIGFRGLPATPPAAADGSSPDAGDGAAPGGPDPAGEKATDRAGAPVAAPAAP
ncbi:MFS transporter [Micromonospora sp. NBC_01813]|uniref:MFS transporter n=1 Tax=Micromonospora sp. NBC_01813 TaxID=2975988 RepID=UPI002DDA1254|nr:MFS transporter [Micromonospora sp. NBC_01813]WSA08973.1 MFS transporter [Micromonospora sp. NBC_01813]